MATLVVWFPYSRYTIHHLPWSLSELGCCIGVRGQLIESKLCIVPYKISLLMIFHPYNKVLIKITAFSFLDYSRIFWHFRVKFRKIFQNTCLFQVTPFFSKKKKKIVYCKIKLYITLVLLPNNKKFFSGVFSKKKGVIIFQVIICLFAI